jgi:hypothetical protein
MSPTLGALAMLCILVGVMIVDDVVLFPAWIPFALGGMFGVAAFLTS